MSSRRTWRIVGVGRLLVAESAQRPKNGHTVVGDDGVAVLEPLGGLRDLQHGLADLVDDLLVGSDLLHGRAADDQEVAVGQELHVVAVVVAGVPEEGAVVLDLDDLLGFVVGDDDVPFAGGRRERGGNEGQGGENRTHGVSVRIHCLAALVSAHLL